jgi:pseudaminic acid cytidylyltransferase
VKTIAVIPARGGSKRIPRKNIKPMLGRPMMSWVIDACLAAGVFERVLVSTDDAEIAAVARDSGAEVPFTRPADIADDQTPIAEVMAHAAAWLEQDGQQPDALTLVYSTAALLRPEDLRKARDTFAADVAADYLVSVTEFPFPIDRALVDDGSGLRFRHPEHATTRSQDLPEYLHDAAQFVFGRRAAWRESRPIFGPSSIGYRIPRTRVQDIDTPEDWAHAEALMQVLPGK